MNRPEDIKCVIGHKHHEHKPTWGGDNRKFIASLIPFLCLNTVELYALKFAYGLLFEGDHSYEMDSDGATGWRDAPFFAGIEIKNPAAVVHDALNRVKNHTTPDNHKWSLKQTNMILRKLARVFGYGPVESWVMWCAVCVTKSWWWR